jgi:hypothetical protein
MQEDARARLGKSGARGGGGKRGGKGGKAETGHGGSLSFKGIWVPQGTGADRHTRGMCPSCGMNAAESRPIPSDCRATRNDLERPVKNLPTPQWRGVSALI